MKTKILITGIAGSGKSTVSKALNDLGYESHDIENIEGMFNMYRKDTGEIYEDYDNADPEKIKNAEWLCDVTELKKLFDSQKSEIAFYCGIASNMKDIVPLFEKVILLQTSSDVLHKRLSFREGTEDIGNNEKGRQVILGWKDWWEGEMIKAGAIAVDANGEAREVTEKIKEVTLPF